MLAGPGTSLTTDQLVQASDLSAGVAVLLDGPPDPTTVDGKPVMTVVLDLPFPASQADKVFWGGQVSGTVPLTLAGGAIVAEQPGKPAVTWKPTPGGATFLTGLIDRVGTDQVLAHLTLSGRSVAAAADGRGVVNGLALTAGTAPGTRSSPRWTTCAAATSSCGSGSSTRWATSCWCPRKRVGWR